MIAMALLVTHTNGPFDGKEIRVSSSKVILGKHENTDIDLAFDPLVSGWVVIERIRFGFFITVKGDIEIDGEPLSEIQRYRVEGNSFNLKIAQSTFFVDYIET